MQPFLKSCVGIYTYTTYTNFSTKYPVICKVYTDVGGKKLFYHGCPPVRKIIHSLKLVDYLHIQVDKPWYNYYLLLLACSSICLSVYMSHINVPCIAKALKLGEYTELCEFRKKYDESYSSCLTLYPICYI